MKRIVLTLFCGLLGIALTLKAIPRQAAGQPEMPTEKLVNTIRLLNTEEYSYRQENHRFANLDELLVFLRQKAKLSRSPIDLENPKPYELAITTTPDAMHYQITLQRPSDMNDKSTWCKTAAFSDDRGVIFLGQAIGCDATPSNFQQSGGLNDAAPLLRRVAVKHHGFNDATLNDAKLSELEAYEGEHRQDLPKVETRYDQKEADAMKSVLENFWKERGITVDVRTSLNRVPNAPRYAILEFDVYKR